MKANTLILILSLMLASFLFTSCDDFFENLFPKSTASSEHDDDDYEYLRGADGFTYKDIRDDDYRGGQKYRKTGNSSSNISTFGECDDDDHDDDYDDYDDDDDDDDYEECKYFRYYDDD